MNRRQATAFLLAGLPVLSAAARIPARAEPTSPPKAAGFSTARFPLRDSPDKRCLTDADGQPFLVTGDAGWSLIADLSREDAEFYLDRRRQQGFNAVLVNMIEHEFTRNAPANAYGEQPFLAPSRFDRPNPLYFDHAKWVVERALAKGLLVLLAPAYLGAGGGGQGWYTAMFAAGHEALRAYGRYIGERFRDHPNIIWVHGGDYDDPDRSLVEAVVAGIRESDPKSLHTVHGSRDTVIADYWKDDEWLAIDTVYTYDDVHAAMRQRHERHLPLPILMIEALYEGEHGTDEQMVRRQAYGAILGGAAGQVYGNSPVWHFSAPGLFGEAKVGWKDALGQGGAIGMTQLRSFFEATAWWKIAPDDDAILPGSHEGDAARYAICGAATDNSFAAIYLEGGDRLAIKPAWSVQTATRLLAFDPTSGEYEREAILPPTNGRSLVVPLPARANARGFSDWVLLVAPLT